MNNNNSNVVSIDGYRSKPTEQPSIATNSVSRRPEWETAVNKRFNVLLSLQNGWDNFDAKKLDRSTAEFANKLIHYIWPVDAPAPFIAPTCYGGLQFEWRLPHFELEIEIVRQHHVEVFIADNADQSETCFTCKHDLTELFKAVEKFCHQSESSLNAATAA